MFSFLAENIIRFVCLCFDHVKLYVLTMRDDPPDVFRHTDFSNFLVSLVILALAHKLLFLGEMTEVTWDTNLITKILEKLLPFIL
jgi:hypothetical protein